MSTRITYKALSTERHQLLLQLDEITVRIAFAQFTDITTIQ